jgi:4'-phosphopantetheinyl transferase
MALPAGPEVLSQEERDRAARFRFERDSSRFLARRILLRSLLARYLGLCPDRVRLRSGDYGKPEVDNAVGLRFNLSHSHGLALFAFARGNPVGIDCERIQPGIEIEPVARQFFSPGEQRQLEVMPEGARLDAFYRCWTRKEAYVKARGLGLSLALTGFEVPLEPHGPAKLVACELDPEETRRWLFYPLHPSPDYAAALVMPDGCHPPPILACASTFLSAH